MERTFPSVRIASVMEYAKWMSFHETLDKEDRKLLDDMAFQWEYTSVCSPNLRRGEVYFILNG